MIRSARWVGLSVACVAVLAPSVVRATPLPGSETFTLRCAMSETEKLGGKETASRTYTVEITIDLKTNRFHVFENAAKKHHSGKVETIHKADAEAIHLTKPMEMRHGTETVNDSGLRLDRRDLSLTGEAALKDGGLVLQTTWNGACARVSLKPFPPG